MNIQWVDFKLENVLVSLHCLKTMGLSPFGASAPLSLIILIKCSEQEARYKKYTIMS